MDKKDSDSLSYKHFIVGLTLYRATGTVASQQLICKGQYMHT